VGELTARPALRARRAPARPLTLADPVGAATRTGENMVDALDGDVGPQHGAKNCQFRTTQTLASCRRRANRAVVLDEQKAFPRFFGDARHVALAASNFRKRGKFLMKRTSSSDELAVIHNAGTLAVFDQLFHPAVAEDAAHGPQQIEGQIGMTVGEAVVTSLRQPPIFPWPPPSLAPVLALHQACRFELAEMLTRAGRGHVEA
jgi:hypothetical protein